MATKSSRKIKRKTYDIEEGKEASPKAKKGCQKAACADNVPICFARATNACCGSGWTSRWNHVTLGEHFCNECFEYYYRSTKGGNEFFLAWKRLWSGFGKSEANVTSLMNDQMLPYWTKCNLCDKWRQVYRATDVTPAFLKGYVCSRVMKNQTQEQACETPEDYRVEYTHDIRHWVDNMSMLLLIKNAIYAPYVRSYFPDKVGISPSDTSIHKFTEGCTEVRSYLCPLQDPGENLKAFSLPPHYLEDEEIAVFQNYKKQNMISCYLIIRNTAVTLWSLNVKKWVTVKRCMNHIIVRGLSRVWVSWHVADVLCFLTAEGFINHGVATLPPHIDFLPMNNTDIKQPVIIIGAGLAGLSAARQLTNYGIKVKVLEASDFLGGRAMDPENSITKAGSHIIAGSYNNPIVVMCKQADIGLRELEENCVLLDEAGERIDDKTDKRMQFHFEAMLDNNKQLKHEQKADKSLLDRFMELHQQFKDESGIPFSKMEEALLQFHMSNLEYACGSSLSNVSSLYWDQNDEHPQFLGPPVLMQDSFTSIVDKLADGIEVIKECEVCSINYKDESIQVTSTSGEKYEASKVLVTTSLNVLKKGTIQFTPELPTSKEITLGCGHVEKIVLEFTENFWGSTTKNGSIFGRVTTSSRTRGMFDVFYDLSKPEEGRYILMSYISGEAIEMMKDKKDKEIMEECLQVLRKLFPKETITEPVKSYVSHWQTQNHVNMSYTYIPINTEPEVFDQLAKEVDGKVYFAGEGTHRQFYQTLAGAYISGLREADKIYRSLTAV